MIIEKDTFQNKPRRGVMIIEKDTFQNKPRRGVMIIEKDTVQNKPRRGVMILPLFGVPKSLQCHPFGVSFHWQWILQSCQPFGLIIEINQMQQFNASCAASSENHRVTLRRREIYSDVTVQRFLRSVPGKSPSDTAGTTAPESWKSTADFVAG